MLHEPFEDDTCNSMPGWKNPGSIWNPLCWTRTRTADRTRGADETGAVLMILFTGSGHGVAKLCVPACHPPVCKSCACVNSLRAQILKKTGGGRLSESERNQARDVAVSFVAGSTACLNTGKDFTDQDCVSYVYHRTLIRNVAHRQEHKHVQRQTKARKITGEPVG
jgi:hypothetical protein